MSESPTTPHPHKTDEICPGIALDWYFDSKIVACRLTAITPELLTKWSSLALQTLRDWPIESPCLILNDLSHRGVALIYASHINYEVYNAGIIPSERDAAEIIVDNRPELRVYIAYVFNNNFSGNLGQIFARSSKIGLIPHPRIKYNIFLEHETAFTWLTRFLPTKSDTPLPLPQE